MTIYVNIRDAESQLADLIAKVEAGENVTIMRAGAPVADLVAHNRRIAGQRNAHGVWRGRMDMTEFEAADARIAHDFGSAP